MIATAIPRRGALEASLKPGHMAGLLFGMLLYESGSALAQERRQHPCLTVTARSRRLRL